MAFASVYLPGSIRIQPLEGSCDFSMETEIPFTEKELDLLTEKEIGALGERLVSLFLEGKGFEGVRRNVRYDPGEIDVLGYDEPYWVLCEVKTRVFEGDGEPPVPEVAITKGKQRIYHRIALAFYSLNPDVDLVRFDAVGVTLLSTRCAQLHYLPCAWDMEYFV